MQVELPGKPGLQQQQCAADGKEPAKIREDAAIDPWLAVLMIQGVSEAAAKSALSSFCLIGR